MAMENCPKGGPCPPVEVSKSVDKHEARLDRHDDKFVDLTASMSRAHEAHAVFVEQTRGLFKNGSARDDAIEKAQEDYQKRTDQQINRLVRAVYLCLLVALSAVGVNLGLHFT